MSDDVVNFEVGKKFISHVPDDWDGSVEMMMAYGHDEDEPCEICNLSFMSPPRSIATVIKVDRELGTVTAEAAKPYATSRGEYTVTYLSDELAKAAGIVIECRECLRQDGKHNSRCPRRTA